VNPHQYPVGLERSLHDLKTKLVLEARGVAEEGEDWRTSGVGVATT
jgi:hypothetical protein